MKLNIYVYDSALAYLIDFYKQLKSTTDSSLKEWVEKMGFESPSLMMDLLKKKRPLKLKFADNLARGMGLDKIESTYFKTLIQIEKSNPEEKSRQLWPISLKNHSMPKA
jgi:uncharacterized protein (TIGR02147 family)